MSNPQTNPFRMALESKEKELAAALKDRGLLTVEYTAEDLEQTILAAEREIAVVAKDRETRLLRDVRGALVKLEEGSYGICDGCEEEIQPKRLRAVPWARYCLRCQEQVDRESGSPVVMAHQWMDSPPKHSDGNA
jgi:DnaK suppressor protein